MQSDLANMSAEGPGTVMVLAMHVVGDSSANRHKTSAGSHWKEPSLGKKNVDDSGEADPAFAANHSTGFVKTENPVETPAVDKPAPSVETRIPIAATESIRKQ
jgi:hypothetical protein